MRGADGGGPAARPPDPVRPATGGGRLPLLLSVDCVPEGLGCSATGVFDSPDDAVPVAVRRARRMRTSANGGSLGGGVGYFPAGQSCLEAAINESQSSGGLPRASILANTL